MLSYSLMNISKSNLGTNFCFLFEEPKRKPPNLYNRFIQHLFSQIYLDKGKYLLSNIVLQ